MIDNVKFYTVLVTAGVLGSVLIGGLIGIAWRVAAWVAG